MKSIAAAVLVALSFATFVSASAKAAEPGFGTRGWFDSRLNGG